MNALQLVPIKPTVMMMERAIHAKTHATLAPRPPSATPAIYRKFSKAPTVSIHVMKATIPKTVSAFHAVPIARRAQGQLTVCVSIPTLDILVLVSQLHALLKLSLTTITIANHAVLVLTAELATTQQPVLLARAH